jgi:hypothetical protein
MEHCLPLALLATHQTLDDLDKLEFQSWSSLHQPDGFSLSLFVSSSDIVLGQLHGIGITLSLARLRLGHRVVSRCRCFRAGGADPSKQVVGNVVGVGQVGLATRSRGSSVREELANPSGDAMRTDGDDVVAHGNEVSGVVVREEQDSSEGGQGRLACE